MSVGVVNNVLRSVEPIESIRHISDVMLSTKYTLNGMYRSPLTSGGTFTSTGKFDWDLLTLKDWHMF